MFTMPMSKKGVGDGGGSNNMGNLDDLMMAYADLNAPSKAHGE